MLRKKINITKEQEKKCHKIIHTHAAICGAVGAGTAQLPCADTVPITATQIAMIIELGIVFNQKISKSVARSILASASASFTGRGLVQIFMGWWPFIGNTINLATAFGLTEAIGWIAVDRFTKEKFYDDGYNNEKKSTEAEDDYFQKEVVEMEAEKKSLIDEANKFFNNEKTCEANKSEYSDLVARMEGMIRNLSPDDVLYDVYDRLCELRYEKRI